MPSDVYFMTLSEKEKEKKIPNLLPDSALQT